MSEAPAAKRRKKADPKPTVIGLHEISPDTFARHAAHVAFEGRVISATAFAPANATFSFVLAPKQGAPEASFGASGHRRIEVEGGAARGASEVVLAGREVILLGRGGVCDEVAGAKGKGKGKGAQTEGAKRYKVVYKQQKVGIHLWIRNDQTGHNDHYHFRGKPNGSTRAPLLRRSLILPLAPAVTQPTPNQRSIHPLQPQFLTRPPRTPLPPRDRPSPPRSPNPSRAGQSGRASPSTTTTVTATTATVKTPSPSPRLNTQP